MSKLGLRLHADEEHWIPLSDLMTGLMFLFLLIALAYMVEIEVQHAQPQDALKTYAATRAQLYNDLNVEFGAELRKWGGTIDANTLSVRFDGVFATGSATLQPRFKAILDDFFPRYLRIITEPQYRAIVSEVRIEGYTSTLWQPGASLDESYIGNMVLSQDRARSVLKYVFGLPAAQSQKHWLTHVFSTDGFSFSHLVRNRKGLENMDASERLEFQVQTNANKQIRTALHTSKAPPVPPPAPPLGPPAIVTGPMPPYPAWASHMIGKPLSGIFPNTVKRCWGYLDGVTVKYVGHRPGAKLFGWGYDMTTDKPMSRVVLVDARGLIVGAANGGIARPDVPGTLKWIRSMTTGWEGYVGATSRPLAAWGVMTAPQTVCRLNIASPAADEKL